jgi:signal transduction histidine kinase
MDSSAIQSSRRSRDVIPHPASLVKADELDTLSEVGRLAGDQIREASLRVVAGLPADLQRQGEKEIERQILWLVRAAHSGASASEEDHGATAVLRRRIIEMLRASLVQLWTERPADADAMLSALQILERAHAACAPGPDQSFAAELADRGGLDLVVEVGHDMRSPLTSILFLSEILHRGQSGPLNEVQKRQVGIVYSAALGLVSMASDMIEVARGGNRLSSKNPAPFSINELLNSVRDLVAPTAEEKGLELRIGTLPSAHRLGFPIALSRVLLNLTTNALKFTHEGSVELTATPVDGNTVEFAVRDSGPGIAPEALNTLYQPFRREPNRQTGYCFSGTGLGLAICRRLVAAMGSQLQVESRRDWGTRFSFRIHLPPASML